MTKLEALAAMDMGYRVTHIYFLPGEWVKLCSDQADCYEFEDGAIVSIKLFWSDRCPSSWDSGWSIYQGTK